MDKKDLENLGFKGSLIAYEKKNYSPWKYDLNETSRDFLEGTLNLIKSNPAILEKVSFGKEYCGAYESPDIYLKISKFGKTFETKSSLGFPVKGESIISLIEQYLSGDILIRTHSSCFPDNFWIKIDNFGSVKYHIGMFPDSLLFYGVGNLDLDPQENINKLKKYYKV